MCWANIDSSTDLYILLLVIVIGLIFNVLLQVKIYKWKLGQEKNRMC